MTAQLILRGRVERHIADIRDWYAEQSPGLDAEFGTALDEADMSVEKAFRLNSHAVRRARMRRRNS